MLAIDAWHKPLRAGGSSSVHVDLSFREGRLGGDNDDFPFTFRIKLKKALLTIKVESPLKIERKSVARGIPSDEAEYSRIRAVREEAKANASLKGRLSPAAIHLTASGELSSGHEVRQEDQVRVVQHIPRIIASPIPGGQQEYGWELSPGYDEELSGSPWEPVEHPRLSVRSPESSSAIDPIIKVIVTCRLEDIEITDLTPKQSGFTASVREAIFNEINMAAAIQQIKLTLREANLEVGKLDDRFADIILADALSVEE
ncbi:hypothetical protein ABIC65_003333 [Sphingomonas trueperi]|uniref:hypothetical protein n=1 Tax=Sphingomonas trueperi TaxID=53317 RepID=UPI0033999A34